MNNDFEWVNIFFFIFYRSLHTIKHMEVKKSYSSDKTDEKIHTDCNNPYSDPKSLRKVDSTVKKEKRKPVFCQRLFDSKF